MKSTPLRLENYFFTRIYCQVNPEFALGSEEERMQRDVDVVVKHEFFKHDADPHRFQITLTIDKVSSSNGALPYVLDAQVVGFFTVSSEFQHNDIEKLVQINGASMLYAAAREYVLMVTGRGPWGAMQLPTVSFYSPVSQHEAVSEQPARD